MAQSSGLDPSAFSLPGGPTGVLLLHGYTGAPPEMRLVGDYLNARGLAVVAPLLPGHGTTVHDMNRYRWQDWLAAAERALADMLSHYPAVFVAGLSMGSLLALHIAAHHAQVAGVVAYSPAVLVKNWRIYLTPVLKHVISSAPKSARSDLDDPEAISRLWSYDRDPAGAAHEVLKLQREVRRSLPLIQCPLLVVYSPRDCAIHPDAGRYTYNHAGTTDKQVLVLERSGHCLTVDSEWQQVAERTYQFILQHSPQDFPEGRRT